MTREQLSSSLKGSRQMLCGPQPSERGEGAGPAAPRGPGSGPAAAAHLLLGACHLEAGAEVVQPLALLMPPQALQVLPQHLDDLEREGGLSVYEEAQRGCCQGAQRHRCQPGVCGKSPRGPVGVQAAPVQGSLRADLS